MKRKYRRHTLEYKQQIISEIANGIRSKAAICREEEIASSMVDRWQRQACEGTLRDHPTAKERQLLVENDWYKKKVAELTRQVDLLKKIDEFSVRTRRLNSSVVTERNLVSRRDVKS